MLELRTPRMRLVGSTAELVRSEIFDRTAFARALDAEVPPDWPPDEAADALPWFLEQLERSDPSHAGWYGFYGIVVDGSANIGRQANVLVGGGGPIGPPIDRSVEIGYSVMPAFQRRGYALEMVTAVIEWISADSRVEEITAETDSANVPSRNLLGRLGFVESGPGREIGSLRFKRHAAGASLIADRR